MTAVSAVDLFCGAGGTSTGLADACAELGIGLELLAVNHWQVAIDTHTANHPWADHRCADVYRLQPRDAVPRGSVDLLVASPTCTFYSRARGGRPVSRDQKYGRMTPTQVVRWADELGPKAIIVENVPEIVDWGPCDRVTGLPIRARRGMYFRRWIARLKRLGFQVEWNILNAANYGDPQTRRRFYLIGRRDGKPIVWPAPTHSEAPDLFGLKPWVAAREIIDWSNTGRSIFGRRKPLAPKTLARIEEGFRRQGPAAEPFILLLTHGGRVHSVDEPVPTVTGANRGELALVQPFVLSQASGGAPRGTDKPVPTIPTDGAHALVQPFLTVLRNNCDSSSIDAPVPTLAAGGQHVGLVQPFLVPFYGERSGQAPRTHSIDGPVPTLPASPKFGVVQPFVAQYYGTSGASGIDSPVPTVTTKDRFGLVTPVVGEYALDIRFRMFTPRELARAMGFPEEYQFTGTKTDAVRQIGNAVCKNLAQALCRAVLAA